MGCCNLKVIKLIVLAGLISSLTACSVNIGLLIEVPEVLELSDGSYKVFVSAPSKLDTVKMSKGLMDHTCEKSGKAYELLSEQIQMTGKVSESEVEETSFKIDRFSYTSTSYKPKHNHEGEFHFRCVEVDKIVSTQE